MVSAGRRSGLTKRIADEVGVWEGSEKPPFGSPRSKRGGRDVKGGVG